MLIYILLVITIIVSCMTCIITVILEKKELQIQRMNSEEQTKTSMNLLSKTVDITKTIEILDLSDSSDEDYSQEPVIIAVLDEDAQATK